MPDSFEIYLKKQLLQYALEERKKGVPLEKIEEALLNAGHEKNIIDDVFYELKKEEEGKIAKLPRDEVKRELDQKLKESILQFFGKNKPQMEVDGQKIVNEVIEEAEIIEEKTILEGIVFFVYLVIIFLVIMFSAGGSNSEIVNVALGFSPLIISVFVSFLGLKLADNVPLYVFIPLLIVSAFYGISKAGIPILTGMDIESLSVINFVFAFIFNILIVYIRFLKPESMKRKVIKKIPKNNLEDKKSNKKDITHHETKQLESENLEKEYNQKDEQAIKDQKISNLQNNTLPEEKRIHPEIEELRREFNF